MPAAPFTRTLFNWTNDFPEPGSEAERVRFLELHEVMKKQVEEVFPDSLAERTVVINPSLTLDAEILSKTKGALNYEERLLCMLMLLRMPQTKVIYITSVPVPEVIIDYYLTLLPGITGQHARKRLTMLSCYDISSKPLTQKILERPRLLETIRKNITNLETAHLTCYNITPLEKTMAVHLGIPLFGTDPDKFYEGSKSGARKTFRTCGIDLPNGFEDLHSRAEMVKGLADLKRNNPALRKAVVKINDGFSGDGNAIFRYGELDIHERLEANIDAILNATLKMVVEDVGQELFFEKYASMGGIVEEFIDGEVKVSPSVQCVIKPDGSVEVASTHDQVLGGPDGQIYIGACFPADPKYSASLAEEGKKIALELQKKGAIGRFAVDFLTILQEDGSWKHYAIEINLRKGGTTHPFLMLQFLTNGKYHPETGEFITGSGNKRCYFASDNICEDRYIGLTPGDLIDIAMFHSLGYDGATQEGAMFHLVGALSEFGKLGMVCIGSTPERAKAFYDRALEVLDAECAVG